MIDLTLIGISKFLEGTSPDNLDYSNIKYHLSIKSGLGSEDIQATFSIGEYVFTCSGYKEMSYGRWVNSHWGDWKLDYEG